MLLCIFLQIRHYLPEYPNWIFRRTKSQRISSMLAYPVEFLLM
nr:MAG TPA: hypothetical protein [Bacteriophage sp.]